MRTLFMQAARVILLRPASWPKHGFGVWLARAAQRLHPNVLAAALANKLARIAWTVLARKNAVMRRASRRRQPETLTKGMTDAQARPQNNC